MAEYNSKEIREAAKHLNEIANTLQSLRTGKLTKISRQADDLKGDTATALNSQLERLSTEMSRIYTDLGKCYGALYKFADLLDIADEKAKQLIGSK